MPPILLRGMNLSPWQFDYESIVQLEYQNFQPSFADALYSRLCPNERAASLFYNNSIS